MSVDFLSKPFFAFRLASHVSQHSPALLGDTINKYSAVGSRPLEAWLIAKITYLLRYQTTNCLIAPIEEILPSLSAKLVVEFG
jgi:hypothetical protein